MTYTVTTYLTEENTLSRASLEAFTKAELLDYYTLELHPMLQRCWTEASPTALNGPYPIVYQGVCKSHTKTVMIDRILKLQESIIRHQKPPKPPVQEVTEVEPEAVKETATASDIGKYMGRA